MFLRMIAILPLIAGGAAAQPPGQPYSSYWFPNELLAWTPAGDPDAPYNRGTLELADRSLGDTRANGHAHADEGRFSALSIMYPSTSGNPSQGGPGFDVYAFGYWQYCDRLVMWGGSAGEGLILSPSADVIDAGHRNGVPVYGTIFFPPTAYGGQIQWVWDFVQKSGEAFPVADKLIEVAEYYGFDGWFINQETAGGNPALAQALRNLMVYVHENSDIRILWYDSMVEGGGIAWQNALNVNNDLFFQDGDTLVSDEMFLNFWWSTNGLALSAAYAETLGRSPYDLHAGADVQANGYNTTVNWAGVFPEGKPHVTSVGFYCPNWTYSNSTGPGDFYTRDNRFWVGANRDPSNTETTHPWKGMAHYVPATTPITSVPFVTTFCAGQGNLYAREGEVLGAFSWNNRSLQDVLPTWRWIVDSPGTPLYPDIDFTAAYWGGSCVRVEGALSPGSPSTMYLYKTDLTLSSGDRLVLAYDAGDAGQPSCMQVGLAFENPESFTWLDVGTQTGEGWNDWEADLSAHSGRPLSVIAFRFDAPSAIPDYVARLGMLGILQGEPDVPSPPSGLWVEDFQQTDDTHGTVRLRWNASPDPTALYMVSRVNADESRTWLWSSLGEACFVPELVREGSEDSTTIEVTAVGAEYGVSDPVSTTVGWTATGIAPGTGRFPLALSGGIPNPLRGPAAVAYTLPSSGPASLRVYGLDGRLAAVLAEGDLPAGTHQAAWDPRDLPAGVYFLRLSAGGVAVTERCVILR